MCVFPLCCLSPLGAGLRLILLYFVTLAYDMIECLVVKQRKTITNGGSSRKVPAPVSSGQFQDREEGLILLLILWKEIVIRFYKKQRILKQIVEEPCLQPVGGEGQLSLQDCVDQTHRSVRL